MKWVNVSVHNVMSPTYHVMRRAHDKVLGIEVTQVWNGETWWPLCYKDTQGKAFHTFEGAQAALKFIRKERL
jgi:hypothetical protein